MNDKSVAWDPELSVKFFKLRFKYEWLFKKKKQPWSEFRKILLDHSFPEEITIPYIRKKWNYTYDMYRIAKRDQNTHWKYFKIFEKHYGKKKVLDAKYQSWNDEWRLKLIICMTETKKMKFDNYSMWRTIEHSMRSQDMPNHCCVQDMKGLWYHLKMTFNRKHRLKLKKHNEDSDWPLYEPMLEYFKLLEPEYLVRLETLPARDMFNTLKCRKSSGCGNAVGKDESTFQWSKDITESLIQIRLQNDWIFREYKWAWSKMRTILVEENDFPNSLTSRDLCRKWSSLFSEYQKAKATENKTWLYYSLFELYLGEGNLSLNPLCGWQEEWVKSFIRIRSELDHLFTTEKRSNNDGWRKVEQKLRATGLPLDHSVLDLPDMWDHLFKTFKWKRKFLNQGILNEQWPYLDLMAQYSETHYRLNQAHKNEDSRDYEDCEDDMKLIDIKKLVKPKFEVLEANNCRSCANDEACISLFDHRDGDGVDLASKLRLIGGVEIEQSDSLPYNICLHCLQELETAYKFRRKCQEVDKEFRDKKNANTVKIEINIPQDDIFNSLDADMDFEMTTEEPQPKKKRNDY
ncbi:unnamed protein product [Leptosia nina]|uniref:ZAD domain-containing protein n=1 Tax=Leptosia nina TaxID=320188 RepID=A0AAV1K1H3_9NEOP